MPRALVPLAQGCEEIEAVSIINVLRRGGVEVVTAGLAEGAVRGSRGTMIQPDTTLDRVLDQEFDLVALPGGQPGTDHLRRDARIAALLQRQAARGGWIGAVCAAPLVLAEAGLLEDRRVTCFPGTLDDDAHGAKLEDAGVVVDGRLITGRSAGMAMDFALALVEALAGEAKRDDVEKRLVRG
jgi:4-methyl-5(b-hydroxyethyl)-thiazole monophosphate biosynthesis